MFPIVEFIAGQPGLADRLLAAHIDDGSGRCRVCSGGTDRSVGVAVPAPRLRDQGRATQRAADERLR